MAGARSTNTMAEFMQRMLGDVSAAKLLPDADLEFLVGLETQIIQKARQPIDMMQQSGITAAGGMPGMAGGPPMPQSPTPSPMPMPPGMPPGAAPGGGQSPSPVAGGVPGVMSNPSMPSPDQLQRLLSGVT